MEGRDRYDYDRLFRQQAALEPSIPWNTIHTPLLASTVLGQRPSSAGLCCNICQGFDHNQAHSALAFLATARAAGHSRPSYYKVVIGCLLVLEFRSVCLPPFMCPRRHVCATCSNVHHQARDCADTPADFRFKRGPARPPRPQSHPRAPVADLEEHGSG